jgi:hypothetical protein
MLDCWTGLSIDEFEYRAPSNFALNMAVWNVARAHPGAWTDRQLAPFDEHKPTPCSSVLAAQTPGGSITSTATATGAVAP